MDNEELARDIKYPDEAIHAAKPLAGANYPTGG